MRLPKGSRNQPQKSSLKMYLRDHFVRIYKIRLTTPTHCQGKYFVIIWRRSFVVKTLDRKGSTYDRVRAAKNFGAAYL
uniref:Uncharacterized protein n=1 Tax=Romanomermis culicivorax TaxID=13658 RepID=A0A915ITB0_ROMCU